ncbi:hypothetical protein BGZ94_000972 [Podila epigama]|nr:hypothetical protein BGZ94_000972 [Podila epigama]
MLLVSTGKAAVILGAAALATVVTASVIPYRASSLADTPHLASSGNTPHLYSRSFYERRRAEPFFDNNTKRNNDDEKRGDDDDDNGAESYEDDDDYKEDYEDGPWRRDNEQEENEDVEIYKTKQPNTPPKEQPSDPFAHYSYQSSLPLQFKGTSAKRTIVVGDIHGSLIGFEGFLNQIGYDASKDQLILAGDLVAKGPESLKVIDKARALDAKCVRGNHDDKVLRWRGYLNSLSPSQLNALEVDSTTRPDVDDIETLPEYDPERPELRPWSQLQSIPSDLVENSEHHRIAKAMTPEQYKYLLSCPLILALPKELSVRKVPVYVLHAGIDPYSTLDGQLPWVLTNVRNLLENGTPYRKKKKGHGWAKVFNDMVRKTFADQFMIIYGHDAGRSLNVKEWSVGLDSGCVYGRAMSGYVVETGQVYTVPCPSLDVDPNED